MPWCSCCPPTPGEAVLASGSWGRNPGYPGLCGYGFEASVCAPLDAWQLHPCLHFSTWRNGFLARQSHACTASGVAVSHKLLDWSMKQSQQASHPANPCYRQAATLPLCSCCPALHCTARPATAVAVARRRTGVGPASRGVGHQGAPHRVEGRRGLAWRVGSREHRKHLRTTHMQQTQHSWCDAPFRARYRNGSNDS